ncbi:MAG: hypothetical protein A3J42_07515 [Candidatus Dadabacteria bacterium RIFCSPHIGHO2_12_FULL_53_21]|nr:MAG: hypothetical protein A3J42_07515 [Candidatus Dadabacteria bacterium RIFCSPHIGHO2_12_FULL_53_21]
MRRADSREKLERLIGGLEKKRRNFLLLRGVALTALVFFAALTAVSLLSLPSGAPLYYALLKAALVSSLAFAVYRFIYLPLIKNKSSADTFTELEKTQAGLGEDTLSAFELGEAVKAGDNTRGTSETLALAHIGNVAGKLESIDLKMLFPIGKLRKYALPVAGAAVITAAALFIAPREFPGYLFSLELTPSSGGPNLRLADIEISLAYPEYTKIPPRTLKNSTGDIEAIKGTRVRLTAKPLGRLDGGKLSTENGASYPLNMKDGRITAEFQVLGDGSYRITDESGGLKTRPYKITSSEDKKPEITISSPQGSEIVEDSGGRIEINYDARDDYGLTEFRLIWEGEAGKSGKLIGKAKESALSYNGKYTLDTGGLDLTGGGTLKLRVEAIDNDSVSGHKAGVSNAITVRLRDASKMHRDVMNYAERLMEEMLGVLGDEIEISGGAGTSSPSRKNATAPGTNESTGTPGSVNIEEMLETQRKLTGGIEGASVTLKKTLESMKEDNRSDYTYFAGLANMDVRIDELLGERRGIFENFASIDIPRAGRLMQREIAEFEEDILFLDSMIKGEKLRDSLLSAKELMKEYSELSEMMKKLGETGDEALKAEIEKKLAELSKLMSELARKMSAMSGDIQEGFLNRDAFKSIDMENKLDEISKLMKEGNIEKAMQMLAGLEQSLESMMASLESGLQSFGASSFSQDMSKLNEIIARLDGLEREETGLKDRTEGLKDSLLKENGSGGDNLRKFIDMEKKKVEEIIKNLSQAKSKVTRNGANESSPEGTYLLDTLAQKAEELKNWLDSMEMIEAHKNAKNVEETSKGLLDLGEAGVGNLKAARDEIGNSERLAGEVARDLEGLLSSDNDAPESSGMAKRQDEIREETGGLGDELEDLRKEMLLSPGIGEDLSDAENHMGRASDNLGGNELSKAISNQDEAVKSLKEAREKAESLLQKMQASAQGSGSPVPMVLGQQQMRQGTQGVDTEYVEIPEAAETEIGREFKEKILKAMKGGSPEGYSELNKKYYDRIIK